MGAECAKGEEVFSRFVLNGSPHFARRPRVESVMESSPSPHNFLPSSSYRYPHYDKNFRPTDSCLKGGIAMAGLRTLRLLGLAILVGTSLVAGGCQPRGSNQKSEE